jgi:hypothetical protein
VKQCWQPETAASMFLTVQRMGLLPDGQIKTDFRFWLPSSALSKNIPLNPSGKSALPTRPSHPMRGGSRSSRTCGGMRWTLMSRLTSVADADGEVVWSWRPDAGAKFCESHCGATVARKPGHRGEYEGNRKTIAQGKYWPKKLRKINAVRLMCSDLCRDPRAIKF